MKRYKIYSISIWAFYPDHDTEFLYPFDEACKSGVSGKIGKDSFWEIGRIMVASQQKKGINRLTPRF
jgi:hypothetical protein